MDFGSVFVYKQLLINGLITTLSLSAQAILGGTILGLIVGMLLTTKNKVMRIFLIAYVEVFRGCPLLMQLFMGYFGLSYLGFGISIQAATVGVFTLYGGAYIAEIMRSGIESISRGQWEAAECVGLSRIRTLTDVILPQAFKVSLPPLVGFYLGLIKDTSIASIIGYSELLRESKAIMNITGKPFETYVVVAVIYFMISFPFSKFVSWVERRAAAV